MAKRDRVLNGPAVEGLKKVVAGVGAAFEVADRVLDAVDKRHVAEALSSRRKDFVAAVDVAGRVLGAVDSVLAAQQRRLKEDDACEQQAPQVPPPPPWIPTPPAPRQTVDARVVGRKPDGTIVVAMGQPRALPPRRS